MLRISAKLSSFFLMLTAFVNLSCGLNMSKQSRETGVVETQQQSIFMILDIKDVTNPKKIVGSVTIPFATNQANNTIVSGQNAYVSTNRHLHIINLSNQQDPTLITSIEFSHIIGRAKSSGNYIFIASDQGLYIITQVASFYLMISVIIVAMRNNTTFISNPAAVTA